MSQAIRGTILVATAICLWLGGAARAADSEVERVYMNYHGAIEAAKLCRDMTFDQAAHSKMAAVINQRISGPIGGERQMLLAQAKDDMRGLVGAQSCNDSQVQEALALFDSDLAPALK